MATWPPVAPPQPSLTESELPDALVMGRVTVTPEPFPPVPPAVAPWLPPFPPPPPEMVMVADSVPTGGVA